MTFGLDFKTGLLYYYENVRRPALPGMGNNGKARKASLMKKVFWAVIVLFMVSAVDALAGAAKLPSPVDIPEGASCGECGMTVHKGGLTGSEVITKAGKVDYFCDLGDMLVYYEVLKKKQDVAAIYVKDYETGAWVEGRAAFYMTGARVATPMKYGILAFKDRAGAEKYRAAKGGEKVYSFSDIIASKVYRR